MGKRKIGPRLDGAMEEVGPFGDVMGKLEILAMVKSGPLDDLMEKLGAQTTNYFQTV